MGEGWLLTGEMLELIDAGIPNIVCTQPFGCLPNHVVGKGMVRKIKDRQPQANIVCVDYDPGATRINQENRIKLMLANARLQAEKQAAAPAPAVGFRRSGKSGGPRRRPPRRHPQLNRITIKKQGLPFLGSLAFDDIKHR